MTYIHPLQPNAGTLPKKKIIGINLSGNQKTNSKHALSMTNTPSSCLGFRMTISIRPPSQSFSNSSHNLSQA